MEHVEVEADEAPSAELETEAPVEPTKVDIQKFAGSKNWLGGYRHKVNETGEPAAIYTLEPYLFFIVAIFIYHYFGINTHNLEFHNAETQTNRKVKAATAPRFCRETQTYFQRNKTFQTPQDAATQMTKPGVHVSTRHDRILIPGAYTLADTIEHRRENAAIVIQKYFRRYLAIEIVKHLKIDKARYIYPLL